MLAQAGKHGRLGSRLIIRLALATLALAAGAIAVAPAAVQAEKLSNAGRDFWLGFPTNYGGEGVQTLYIAGATATTGTVTIPGKEFSQNFSVTPGAVSSVTLPSGSDMGVEVSDGTQEKSIHVTAGEPVVVYGLNDYPYTTDAYTGLPTDVIGTSYTVLAWGAGQGSEFSVVASQNNTSVTITPSVAGGTGETRPAGVPYTITLSQGQEYQLRASSPPADLTGTKITSSAPISVYGGNVCANVPSGEFFACDYEVEQNPPESTWGTTFLTEPLRTRKNGDEFEMVADQSETHVKLDGNAVATLNAGEHYMQEVEGGAEFSSDKPIQLAQYSNGTSYDETTGDPFMITIPPYQQFETGYTITTPVNSNTIFENYVNLVVPAGEVGSVKVDGAAVAASEFSPIGSSGFEGTQVTLSPGSHLLTGNGQPFGAFSYGFSQTNGYGYPGGFSLAPVATASSVSLSVAQAGAGSEQCATATVTDREGNPVPGVRVDFVVTGANSASGSIFADSAGHAQFCFRAANAGEDTIIASVGLVSGTATLRVGSPTASGSTGVPPAGRGGGGVLGFKLPSPVLGKTVNAVPVSGVVLIKLPPGAHLSRASVFSDSLAVEALSKGSGFIPLTEARQIPVGSTLDTTRGVVSLTTATASSGLFQEGDFGAGIFTILQKREQRGLTDLDIVNTRPRKVCTTLGKKASVARKRLSSKILGRLTGDAHGKYTTRGQYSAATVRGTSWGVLNRCDGTLTQVKRGTVSVRDLVKRKTIILHAGQQYLAKAP